MRKGVCLAHLPTRIPAALLRDDLSFQGLVVSDDLFMEAMLCYGIEEAPVLALRAGVDLLLLSHNTLAHDRSATERALTAIRQALADGRLTPETVETALAGVRRFSADRSPRAGN